MTEIYQVYRCELCGNIIEVMHEGAGTLSCCGQPMRPLEENTTDAATEKHVPVVTVGPEGVSVKVGSVPHPMEDKHFIEWVEIIDGDAVCRRFLSPGQAPETTFTVACSTDVVAREYCNLHGLWKG